MAFISVENLTTRYNTSKGLVYALEDVNFAIEKGESIGIAGESACGKSTLGLSIIRMISNGKIYSGNVQFDGKSLLDIPDADFDKNIRWKEISMVFQGAMNSLDPVFSIQQQFEEVLKQHNFEGNMKKIIHDSLTSVNLDESTLKSAGLVSGRKNGVRILAGGEITSQVNLIVSGASISAIAAIEKAGGTIETTVEKKKIERKGGRKVKARKPDTAEKPGASQTPAVET